MRHPSRLSDHRGTLALTICAVLAGMSAACGFGGGHDEGYVAVERPASGGTAVAPTGEVTFVPLEGRERESPPPKSPSAQESRAPASATGTGSPAPGEASGNSSRTGTSSPSPAPSPTPSRPTPASTPTPVPSPSVGPARLSTGAPVREATDKRWCEKVTLAFHNTGDSPVRSGTVTFGTHIIDLLGIDWATIESRVTLPVPIAAGAEREETWTVCVEEWRVPWGMRVETRVVGVEWA